MSGLWVTLHRFRPARVKTYNRAPSGPVLQARPRLTKVLRMLAFKNYFPLPQRDIVPLYEDVRDMVKRLRAQQERVDKQETV